MEAGMDWNSIYGIRCVLDLGRVRRVFFKPWQFSPNIFSVMGLHVHRHRIVHLVFAVLCSLEGGTGFLSCHREKRVDFRECRVAQDPVI